MWMVSTGVLYPTDGWPPTLVVLGVRFDHRPVPLPSAAGAW